MSSGSKVLRPRYVLSMEYWWPAQNGLDFWPRCVKNTRVLAYSSTLTVLRVLAVLSTHFAPANISGPAILKSHCSRRKGQSYVLKYFQTIHLSQIYSNNEMIFKYVKNVLYVSNVVKQLNNVQMRQNNKCVSNAFTQSMDSQCCSNSKCCSNISEQRHHVQPSAIDTCVQTFSTS